MMKTPIAKTFTHSLLILLILTACGGAPKPPQAESTKSALSEQTVNAVIWFNTSAENAYIFEQTFRTAALMVEENQGKFDDGRPPAIIIDVDETVLDNSPYQVEMMKKGEVFTSDSWAEWVMKEAANTLPGAERFLEFCSDRGVEVFYISNRSTKFLDQTVRNLEKNNLPNADPDHVLLMQENSSKTERRNSVEGLYNVILYLGDNLLDFDDRFEDRSSIYGKNTVSANLEEFLPKFVLLPNPMYGQWLKAFDMKEGATDVEKAAEKVKQTQQMDY